MTSRHTAMILAAQDRMAALTSAWTVGDIYRSPDETNGQIGAHTVVATDVPGWRRPATENPRMLQIMPMLRVPLNSGRISWVLKLKPGVDIRVGDQWKEAGVYYHVEGVAAFHTGTLCALTEPKQ